MWRDANGTQKVPSKTFEISKNMLGSVDTLSLEPVVGTLIILMVALGVRVKPHLTMSTELTSVSSSGNFYAAGEVKKM